MSTLMTTQEILNTSSGYFQGLMTVLAIGIAYFFAIRQMRQQTSIQVKQDLRARRADALQAVWQLMQAMSNTENANSIMVWQQTGNGANKHIDYFIRCQQAEQFVQHTLPNVFYGQHAGLYIPTAIKELLFKYRTEVYGFLLRQKQTTPLPEQVKVENAVLSERLICIYNELNKLLKQEITLVYDEKTV